MEVITLENQVMSMQIIKDLQTLIPNIEFKPGNSFYWSPEKKLITYKSSLVNDPAGQWALLHEVAHASLNHVSYSSDLGLLKLEVDAWDRAKVLASKFRIKLEEDHIQDCLDTYRDWLHRRSTCPSCEIICIQNAPTSYKCHNCFTTWTVTASRFCRSYRLLTRHTIEKRLQPKTATFS
jgi:hypothetical protein